ncbi:hypothetical protein ACIBQ1_42555 [Nonomuraea sp. NPDC050153]|uniref:hypothetical protein n=1 Tax=Nonomuraea sp. NPDC050153 TaxID=3364359 RepID=UPI003797C733
MLTALADDGVTVPAFLADALAEAWGEDEAETTPSIRYRPLLDACPRPRRC